MKHPTLFRRIAPRSVYDVMAAIACSGALAGGTAYAANTIGGGDIIDNSVSSADIRDDTLGFGGLAASDLGPGSVGSSEVADGSLTGFDIKDGWIGQVDLADGTVNSPKVADNSLTGTDINESTLDLSSATVVTFASPANPVELTEGQSFTKVTSRALPPGAWAITATVSTFAFDNCFGVSCPKLVTRGASCELRNGAGFIGGANDRRTFAADDTINRSLAVSGGAQIPAGGGEVSLWCRSEVIDESVERAQMMMIRVGGFS